MNDKQSVIALGTKREINTQSDELGRNCSLTIKANSHRHARHDKTVLSVSRPLQRCELHFRQHKTVDDRENLKYEHDQSKRPIHNRHDTDRTDLSCLVWRRELSRPDRRTSAFSVGVCRAAQALPVRPPDALRRRTHLSGRLNSHRLTRHRQDRRVASGGRCELDINGGCAQL